MNLFRILLVGFLFSWFGLICLIGNLFFIPINFLRLNEVNYFKNFSRDLVHCAWKFFIFCTEILGYLRYEFTDFNQLGEKSQIIICNHPSLLDVVLLLSKVRRVNCVVKAELSKNVFLYPAIKACGYILNTKNEELLHKSLEVLKKEESLLIFPEGTRTKEKIIFHKAPFYLAIHSAKWLTPVFIQMDPKTLQKGVKWYHTPKNKVNYKIYVGNSIKIDEYSTQNTNPIRVRSLHKEMMQIYHEEIQ
ncbi:MAG: 1-acyl-sn-glycerol-3-phosphate acyltransferase [Helicobacter sp.]|nr:1-acyl-sn-glycerol-3-phosphate acyltransferase [Helicobacter sp.]